MSFPIRPGRIARGLRFRLTLIYVTFFSALLVLIGLFFVEIVRTNLDSQVRQLLDDEWVAVRGYLRIEKEPGGVLPRWYFDREDPDESLAVSRLRRICLITDTDGRVLEVSQSYRLLGIETPTEISSIYRRAARSPQPVWRERVDVAGVPYLVRYSILTETIDKKHVPFLVAIGRSLAANNNFVEQLTRNYFTVLPGLVFLCGLMGWFVSSRALTPVKNLANAAARISTTNLRQPIPARGAGDELDHLIQTFNSMMERLANSFDQIRQFSTDVSRALRTPGTAVRGQLEVALFTAETPEQYREAIITALEDVERLGQIVRALLLLSQAESGQLALQMTSLDLSRVVRDVVEQFEIPAESAELKLEADLPETCPAEADRIQIERLVSNLLSNAVKYTPSGGHVAVKLRSRNDMVCLEVKDTGQGIPPENIPHIFNRFYRVPSADPDKGLGLGLSFVAWIVKAHNGRVEVESEPGKGTRFRVLLPISQGARAGGDGQGR
ncbi:MAG: ATP-binding protein [Acidobacteria bacterium]|nr:ATP-binding protein [Acidobacteriota bacterium]